MNYYILDPEVAGGLGKHTGMDNSVHPPIVTKLHYEFDGWLGDDLLQTFPCYIVTEKMGNALTQANLTGFKLAKVEVSQSDIFHDQHPDTTLPKFRWLQITGTAGVDDFGLTPLQLVLSQKALDVLNQGNITNCEVAVYND